MTDMSEYYMGNSVQHWYAKLDRIKEEKAELSLALARVKELEAQYAHQDENNRLLVELQLKEQAQAKEINTLKAEVLAMRCCGNCVVDYNCQNGKCTMLKNGMWFCPDWQPRTKGEEGGE